MPPFSVQTRRIYWSEAPPAKRSKDADIGRVAPIAHRRRDRWDVYKWVGKCLSEWEQVEAALARLYDVLLGKPSLSTALRRYGQPRLFEDRAALLERAADRHFVEHPHPTLKADLLELLARLRAAHERRDEIAQGVVVSTPPLNRPPAGPHDQEFALVSRLGLWRSEDEAAPLDRVLATEDLQRSALAFFSHALDVGRHRHRIARAMLSKR